MTTRTAPAPPIIVIGKEELLLFDDVASAEAYIEAIDVKNGEYLGAYDSRGLRLKIEADAQESSFLGIRLVESGQVRVLLDDAAPPSGELERVLGHHLTRSGVPGQTMADAPVAQLILIARLHLSPSA